MFPFWFGAALRAGFDDDLGRPLQGSRFLEAPMATLFHRACSWIRGQWNRSSVLPTRCSTFAARHSWRRQYRRPLMADEFDAAALVERFRERARAVKNRGIPPIEGPERKRFVERMQLDYQDFAMLGDAEASLDDGVLTLRVDLRPQPEP
jgi:hypothetical protein